MSNNDYMLCATTAALNKHEDRKDNLDYQFQDTYTAVVAMFKEELADTQYQEDINDDLVFEIQVYIERYSYSIEIEDVAKQIYKDFDIKGA